MRRARWGIGPCGHCLLLFLRLGQGLLGAVGLVETPGAVRRPSIEFPMNDSLAFLMEQTLCKRFFCFHGSFPPKWLNAYKAYYCAPSPKFVNTSMTATSNNETAIQLASGAQMYNSRQLIRTTQARRSRARGRMAAISLAVKWSEALFAGASTKMHRAEANKTVPTRNGE